MARDRHDCSQSCRRTGRAVRAYGWQRCSFVPVCTAFGADSTSGRDSLIARQDQRTPSSEEGFRLIRVTTSKAIAVGLLVTLLGAGNFLPARAQDTSEFDPASFSVGFELVADGFSRPVQAVNPGDDSGRMFVVEQSGAIRILQDG